MSAKETESSKRKRSTTEPDATSTKKPPQKLRAPNAYKIFSREFFQSDEGKSISEWSERNRKAGEIWRDMTAENKKKYYQIATQSPTTFLSDQFNKRHETERVVNNLRDSCNWAEKIGIHAFYVVCADKDHYVGGTTKGCAFLNGNPHMMMSFVASTKQEMTPPVPKPSTANRQELRTYIQECLNAKYSLAINRPHSKVPYSQLKPTNVIGLPVGMKLQHPSQLNHQDLEVIYSLLPTIKFVDVPPKQSEQQIEHSYASNAPSTSNQVSHDSAVGFTTLGTTGVRDQVAQLTTENSGTIKLLDANNREVGTATVLPGSILHGKNLPSNFIKIAIQHINPGVKPWPAAKGCFDEEELSAGTITGWPQESVIC